MFYQNRFQTWDIPGNSHTSCAFYSVDETGNYPLHCHSFYEMNYLINGKMYNTLDGKSYLNEDNTLFIIPPMAFHGSRNVTMVDSIVIQFSQSFLTSASAHIGQNVLLSATPEKPFFIPDKSGEIYRILENIADFARAGDNSSPASEFTESSLILSLLSACINEKHLLV